MDFPIPGHEVFLYEGIDRKRVESCRIEYYSESVSHDEIQNNSTAPSGKLLGQSGGPFPFESESMGTDSKEAIDFSIASKTAQSSTSRSFIVLAATCADDMFSTNLQKIYGNFTHNNLSRDIPKRVNFRFFLEHLILSRQKKLAQGKLPIEVLKPMLQSLTATDLVVAPDIGIDVGVTRSKGKFLVSSSDPITGVVDRIGWYAVNVSANDVATSGIHARYSEHCGAVSRRNERTRHWQSYEGDQ